MKLVPIRIKVKYMASKRQVNKWGYCYAKIAVNGILSEIKEILLYTMLGDIRRL